MTWRPLSLTQSESSGPSQSSSRRCCWPVYLAMVLELGPELFAWPLGDGISRAITFAEEHQVGGSTTRPLPWHTPASFEALEEPSPPGVISFEFGKRCGRLKNRLPKRSKEV